MLITGLRKAGGEAYTMDSERVERRLVAIMFTDIAGYTALMAGSEARALQAKEQHRALVRPLVERYHGEAIEARGDESLSVFPSALDAVSCAFAIVAELGDSALRLHLGIHLGDIVLEHGEISGDGVNIASRVCALSEGGELCVSGDIYQALRNQPNIEAKPLGERELKNVGRPIAVYALSGPAAPPSVRRAPTSSTAVRVAAAVVVGLVLLVAAGWGVQRYFVSPSDSSGVAGRADRPALAVLPFENLGGDTEQEIFARGLAEDLITRLASWRSFPVIASSSSLNPALPKDVQAAGRELNARYVVVGSARRVGEQVRINVQLTDTASGRSVWAKQYDRDFRDLLVLQTEISEAVVGEVFPELLQFEAERAMHQDAENLDAWTVAMQGWWHFNRVNPEDMARARELFERAVALDPQFGDAYAGLGLAHFREGVFGWSDSPEQSFGAHRAAAEKAVALDEFSTQAYHALGHAFAVSGQPDRGLAALHLGLELNPNNALAHNCYGNTLALVGRSEEAIVALERAMALSPRDPWGFETRIGMAWAYFAGKDYEQAAAWAEQSIAREPSFFAYQVATASAGQLGQVDAAHTSLRELLRLQPDFSIAWFEGFFGWADPDFRNRLLEGLRKAGWEPEA